jgi:hypothetical protein
MSIILPANSVFQYLCVIDAVTPVSLDDVAGTARLETRLTSGIRGARTMVAAALSQYNMNYSS